MIVTLIGYRGSGKSSVAPVVAGALKCQWVDSDREIEKQAGQTIAEIFDTHGEQHFRDLECEVLRRLCQSVDSLVIAAGGGAILRESNRKALKAAGPVVWLTADVNVLAERIQRDFQTAANRPSLTGADVIQEITDVLQARLPLYQAAATLTVETDGRSIEEICRAVLSAVCAPEGDSAEKVSS